jgi:uncharacterized Fe-S cluster-containing radical SAM superfamily protein
LVRRTGQRRGALTHMATLNVFQWLRYGPWLAQVVVTRRCNLTCGYCTEYDRTSDPVPYDELALRLAKLAELRAWAVCLTGGEPTMHPRLPDLVAEMRRLGFKRRMLITNGTRLSSNLIDALNGAGLTDMQISVDGVQPNDVTVKTLQPLRKKLELLAEKATFRVVSPTRLFRRKIKTREKPRPILEMRSPKGDRILPRGMRHLIDETLDDEDIVSRTHASQEAGRHAGRLGTHVFDMKVRRVVGKIDRAVDCVPVEPVLEGRRRPAREHRRPRDLVAPRRNFAG